VIFDTPLTHVSTINSPFSVSRFVYAPVFTTLVPTVTRLIIELFLCFLDSWFGQIQCFSPHRHRRSASPQPHDQFFSPVNVDHIFVAIIGFNPQFDPLLWVLVRCKGVESIGELRRICLCVCVCVYCTFVYEHFSPWAVDQLTISQ
jgi:hypothetical protein